MKTRYVSSALFFILASSTSSLAAATAEEAARIQATFQSYLGPEPGVVTVTPAGDGYEIALDAMPYLKKVTEPNFKASVDAYRFTVTPKGNGEWSVSGNGPYKLSTSVQDVFTFEMAAGNILWSGTYNDTLYAFTEQKMEISALTINQVNVDPTTKIKSSVVTVVDKTNAVSNSKDAGNGLVDGVSNYEMSGLISSTTMEAAPGNDAGALGNFAYVANAEKAKFSTSMFGMSSRPLLDLIAFFVARPSKELLVKDQPLLKEKLLAALPVFASIDGSGAYENVVIDTSIGKFQLGTMGGTVNMNGVTKTGRFAEGIEITGLKSAGWSSPAAVEQGACAHIDEAWI